MNNTLKKILLYIVEVIGTTAIWSILDYFFSDAVDILENLIIVAIIVLLCNITDSIAKKFKKTK